MYCAPRSTSFRGLVCVDELPSELLLALRFVWVTEKIRCPVQSSDAHPLCRTPGERKGGSDVRHVKPKVGARPELNAFVKMGLRVRVRRVGQGWGLRDAPGRAERATTLSLVPSVVS